MRLETFVNPDTSKAGDRHGCNGHQRLMERQEKTEVPEKKGKGQNL